MFEMEKKIKELQVSVASKEENIRQELINLGKNITKENIINEPGDIADIKSQAKDLEKQIPELNKLKQSIFKKINRLERIEELQEQNRLESKSLQEQMRTFYIEIGKAAYTNFKESKISRDDTESIFEDLLNDETRLREIDNEIYQMGSDKDMNFFSGLVHKGKNSLLASRRKTITSNMHNLYREAGENFCKTPIFEQMAEKELSDLAVPYRENLAKADKIDTEEKNLSSETKNLKEELKTLCEGKSAKRKLSEIDSLIMDRNKSLTEAMNFIGDFYYSSRKGVPGTPPFTSIMKKLDALTAENREGLLEIDILKARIEIEKNSANIDKKSRRITMLENEISKRKDEVKTLKKDIQLLENINKDKKTFISSNSKDEKNA